MKAPDIDYTKPDTLDAALRALAGGDQAMPIAGGQTLGPMLNLRLAKPSLLVDLRGLPELRQTDIGADTVFLGAALTHAEIEDWAADDTGPIDPSRGFLPHVGRHIAYRAVRNRGTLGGSLAYADPAANWLTALLALDADVVSRRAGETQVRTALTDFVPGPFVTTLAPGAILLGVQIPRLSKAARWGFHKLARKVGEFAHALAAVVVDPERESCRVVCGAVDGRPLLLDRLSDSIAREARAPALAAIEDELRPLLPRADAVTLRWHAVSVRRAVLDVYPH